MFYLTEISAYKMLTQVLSYKSPLWSCSSSHADYLRRLSWGVALVGTTVPHHAEMMVLVPEDSSSCGVCIKSTDQRYIAVTILPSFENSFKRGGPLKGYLGSATSTSSQLFHSWEKLTNTSIAKRCLKLKETINWFIHSGSNLSNTIFNNIRSILGDIPDSLANCEFLPISTLREIPVGSCKGNDTGGSRRFCPGQCETDLMIGK